MGRFKYGVCEWSVRARGEEFCRMAKEAGLDCLQLGVGEEIFRGKGLADPEVVESYKRGCREYGIEIVSLSPQFVDQYSYTLAKNCEEEAIVLALCDKTLELCKIFGCRLLLLPVLCRNDIIDGPSFHKAVELIRRYAKAAEEAGITVALEMNQSAAQVRNVLDAVDSPNVKLFFDSQNLYAQDGTSMARYFTEMEDVIGGVHLKDGRGSMLSGSLLGEGTSGFYRTAKAIRNSSYSGCLIIESVYDKPGVCNLGTEAELLTRDARTMKEAFEDNSLEQI